MHVALFPDWKNIKIRGFYCGEHCNLNECIVDNLMLQWAPDRSWSNILCTSLTYIHTIYYHTMLWNTKRKWKFWDERISSKKFKINNFWEKNLDGVNICENEKGNIRRCLFESLLPPLVFRFIVHCDIPHP